MCAAFRLLFGLLFATLAWPCCSQGCRCQPIRPRLPTVEAADRMVVPDHKRVVDISSHAELPSRAGIYARPWQMQFSFEQRRDVAQ